MPAVGRSRQLQAELGFAIALRGCTGLWEGDGVRHFPIGRVAEWSNAPVLKTGVPQGTGGSNPSPTALGASMPPKMR